MARNLRAKIPKEDSLIVHDVNTKATSNFAKELGPQGIHVAESVREVAEKAVRKRPRSRYHSSGNYVLRRLS